MGVRVVMCTPRDGKGAPLAGVQNTVTGDVYPFPLDMARRVADEVNAGTESLSRYGRMVGQGLYEIEEVGPR